MHLYVQIFWDAILDLLLLKARERIIKHWTQMPVPKPMLYGFEKFMFCMGNALHLRWLYMFSLLFDIKKMWASLSRFYLLWISMSWELWTWFWFAADHQLWRCKEMDILADLQHILFWSGLFWTEGKIKLKSIHIKILKNWSHLRPKQWHCGQNTCVREKNTSIAIQDLPPVNFCALRTLHGVLICRRPSALGCREMDILADLQHILFWTEGKIRIHRTYICIMTNWSNFHPEGWKCGQNPYVENRHDIFIRGTKKKENIFLYMLTTLNRWIWFITSMGMIYRLSHRLIWVFEHRPEKLSLYMSRMAS